MHQPDVDGHLRYYLSIASRVGRKLSKEEIKYLISLKASGIPIQYQLAANILLDSFQLANRGLLQIHSLANRLL